MHLISAIFSSSLTHPAGLGKNRTLVFTFAFFPPGPEKVSTKQKIQYPVRILDLLMGAGGYREPDI